MAEVHKAQMPLVQPLTLYKDMSDMETMNGDWQVHVCFRKKKKGGGGGGGKGSQNSEQTKKDGSSLCH